MTSPRRGSDDGSLSLAMLVVVIGAGLSLLMVTTVVREIVNTRTASARASALLTARTGLSGALAGLRGARDAGGIGRLAQLPCGTGQAPQVTGTVTGGGGYAATVWYLVENPAGRDEAWVRATGVGCPGQLGELPRYAYISAVGTSADGLHRRTLTGTYQFRLRAKGNMPGGQIRVYRTSAAQQDYCLAAVTSTPGTPLTMQVCAVNADGTTVAHQKFGYLPNLTIKLMTADPALYPEGLCAQAGSPQAVGQTVALQRCGPATQPSQQWSFDQNSNLRGTSDGRTLNDFCWNITQPDPAMPDRRIQLNNKLGELDNRPQRRCGLTRTNYQSWNITADAGSGAAGPESGQLVNFRQFGKCFDYAGGIASGGPNWAFPCKQSPSLPDREWSQVWNQVWNLPPSGVGPIHVVDTNGARRCLRVPGAHVRTYATTAETCPPEGAAVPAELTWWVRGSDAATYDAKYRIEGTGMWAGQCLAPLPGVGSAVQADYIGLAPCSGDYLQKWNALPPVSTSGLSNVIER